MKNKKKNTKKNIKEDNKMENSINNEIQKENEIVLDENQTIELSNEETVIDTVNNPELQMPEIPEEEKEEEVKEEIKEEVSDEIPEEVKDEEVVSEDITAPTDDEEVKEEVIEGIPTNGLPKATVVNCEKLFLRSEPSKESEALIILDKQDDLLVDEANSTEDFYKIIVVTNPLEKMVGYCVKKFIEIK